MGGISRLQNNFELYINDIDVEKGTFRNVVTGKLYNLLSRENVNKTFLATKMGVSKPAITSLLSGDRNITVDKITEISSALGYYPVIDFIKKGENPKEIFIKYFEAKRNTREIRINKSDIIIKETDESIKAFEIFTKNFTNKYRPGIVINNEI